MGKSQRTRYRLRLIDGFELTTCRSRDSISLPTKKCKGLLAYLALKAGRRVERAHLASLIWGEAEERLSRHSLTQALSNIRRAFERVGQSPLRIGPGDVGLDIGCVDVDVLRFRAIAEAEDPGDLEAVLAFPRGELLCGIEIGEERFEDWLSAERRELSNLLSSTLWRLVDRHIVCGDWESVSRICLRLLELDSYDERAHQQLIRSYEMQGRHSEAYQQFERCAALLRQELGIEPAPATAALIREGAVPWQNGEGAGPLARSSFVSLAPGKVLRLFEDEPAIARPAVFVCPIEPGPAAPWPAYLSRAASQELLMMLSWSKALRVFAYPAHGGLSELGAEPGFIVKTLRTAPEGRLSLSVKLYETGREEWIWDRSKGCGQDELSQLLESASRDLEQAVLSFARRESARQ